MLYALIKILLIAALAVSSTALYGAEPTDTTISVSAPNTALTQQPISATELSLPQTTTEPTQSIARQKSTLPAKTATPRFSTLNRDTAYFSAADSASLTRQQRRQQRLTDNANFIPDPDKSLWYALAFPGAGQIYNRKYWKLPIIYGGTLGVIYAITWNGNKYSDYKRAYIEVTDANPNTNYHLEVIPKGYPESSAETYVRNRMNVYRNYRDISIVAGVVLYALSVIDAYVDAQLSTFDISPELTMHVTPSIQTQPLNNQPVLGGSIAITF